MKLRLLLPLFFCVDCFHLTPVLAQYASTAPIPKVDQLLTSLLDRTQVAGLSVSVMQSGELVYSKGLGYARVKEEIPMQPTTPSRTGSVAKVLTATALGKLATDGKLDLDAPLGQYLPFLKEPFATLTTRQVAGHTAGIPHRPAAARPESRHYAEVKETLSFFDDLSLDFTPGSQYQYSTLGYNLLAILIEELSGKRYADYMAEAIFRPLGMDQTYPDPGADLSQADAHLYYLNKGKLKWDRRPIDGSYKLAGAGFRSTSEDLVKMMVGYQNGFISPGVRETMFTSGLLADGEATHVGLGWRLNRDIHDRPTIEHAGSWQGARTVVVHYPAEDLSLAIMINTQCVLFIEETAHLIADQFLSKTGGTPSVSKPAQPLTVRNTGYDGSVTTHTGELALTEGAPGILFMDMDSDWLRQNPVYPLGTAQDHALSTPYGLLYLQLDFTQQPLGKLYQYQVLGDPFHMRQQPTLTLQASQ